MNSVGAKKHSGKRFVHRLSHLSVDDAKPFTDFMKPFLKVSRDEDIERALRNNTEAAERIVKEAVRTGRIWSVPKFRSEDGAHYETGDPIPVGRIRRLTTESVHDERTTMLDQDGKIAAMSMFRYAKKHMGMHLTRTDLPALIATAENSQKALYIEWPVEFLVIAVEPPKAAATPDVIQSLLGRKRPLDTRSESGSSLHSEDSLEIDESEAANERPTSSRHEQRKIPKRSESGAEMYGTETARATNHDTEAALEKLRSDYEQMISDLRECRLEESEVLKDQIRSEAARCVRLESEKRDLQDRIDAMVKENHERTITMMAETFAWKSKYSTAEGESGLLRDRIKDLTERIKELQAEKSSPAVPAKAAVRKNAGHTKPPPAGKPKKKHESDAEIEAILGARTENVKNAVKSADVAEEAAHSTTETTRETTYGDSGHASTSGSPDEYDPLFPEMDRSEGGLSGNSLD